MDNSARCWLVVAAIAPLVAVLSFWSILTFHSYRRQWRTVDLFFVAAAFQEFLNAVFFFGHALLNLTQPSLLPVCTFFVWAALAVRIFQVTTLTSLVMDRALTIRWPYRYRLSVRRNQVRYHIGVLAVTSVLVGVASVFAKSEDPIMSLHSEEWDVNDVYVYHPPPCFLLPFSLDKKFVVFVIFLQAVLGVISLVCLVHVQIKICTTSPQSKEHIQVSSSASMPHPFLVLDSSPPQTLMSPSSTTSSGTAIMSSTHGCLNGTLWSLAPSAIRANSSLKRESVRLRREFRWKAVAMVVIYCNLINHFPYLAMVIMARFVAIFPPLWLESGATYLALAEGLFLPLLFWAVDPMYRAAVAQTFIRTSKTGKSPATTYLGSELDGDTISRRESLSCSTLPRLEPLSMYSSVNGFLCSDTLDKKILLGAESRWIKENAAKEDSAEYINGKNPRHMYSTSRYNDNNMCCSKEVDLAAKYRAAAKEREARLNGTPNIMNEPVYCDPTEMMIMMEQVSKVKRPNKNALEEHIYATLSNRFSTLTEKSVDFTDEDKDEDTDLEEDEDDDSSSFTTSASDDFEFHLTRPPSCTVQITAPSNNQFRGYAGFNPILLKSDAGISMCPSPRADHSNRSATRRDILWEDPTETVTSSASPSRASTMSLRSEDEVARPSYHGRSSPQRRSPKGGRNEILGRGRPLINVANVHSLTRRQKNASLSMNDLDLLNGNECEEEPEEVVYVLSEKSESSISLYRLNHGLSEDGTLDRPLRSPAHRTPLRWASQNAMQTKSVVKDTFRPRRHSTNSLEGEDVVANNNNNVVLKRQFVKNPLMLRTRLSKCGGTQPTPNNNCSNYASNNNNWKYRAAALPRQEFPWRKSPIRPFQIPTTSMKSNEHRINPQSMRRAQNQTSYQKKFISEYL